MYCTFDDIKRLIPESTLKSLTQDDPLNPDIDMDVVNAAIKYSTDKINAVVRGRYPLPLKQPDLVKEIALDLVRHRLYSRRPNGGDLPDAVKEGKKSADSDLTKIARGEMSLSVEESQTAQPENGPWRIKAPKRRFDGGVR